MGTGGVWVEGGQVAPTHWHSGSCGHAAPSLSRKKMVSITFSNSANLPPVGSGPAWSWPSGGCCCSVPGPRVSSPLWGSLHSHGSAPGRAGVSKGAGAPWAPGWVMGGIPVGLALCGPSSRAIILVSMSKAPLVEPVTRDSRCGARASCSGGGGVRAGHGQGSLTVDAVVRQGALGGLAGDIHDGPRGSPSYQASGHDLESQRESVRQNGGSPTRSHSCPEGSSPGTPG